MAQNGFAFNFYMQKGIIERIYEVIAENPGTFQSPSHFINCAILLKLREFKPEIQGKNPDFRPNLPKNKEV